MDKIKEKFKSIHTDLYNINTNLLDDLFSYHKFKEFEKGVNVVKQDSPENKEYIIINGIIREYLLDENNKEVTLNFFTSGVVTPCFCRTENGTSLISVQTLSPCTIGILESSALLELRTNNREFFNALSQIMTKLYREKVHTQILHSSQPAAERLKHFRKKFPGLENTVPNSYIASYLGITNVSLSRLRNKK